MGETRIRGQEAQIRLSRNAVVESTITAIKTFNIQWDFAILEEGYLGEKTMRKDDIFNGGSGAFDIDPESQELLLLIDFIRQRAQRRTAVNDSRVNSTVRLTFPNGDTPLVLLPDMKFDPANLTIPKRDSYVSSSFSYKVEEPRIITA